MEYLINEGNKIGYISTEFNTYGSLVENKLVAGADIIKGQLVIMSDSMTVIPATANSGFVIGVAMSDVSNGEAVAVECEGLVKLTAAAEITAPAKLKSAAAGTVTPWIQTAEKDELAENIIGIALSDAEANGTVIVRLSL